MFDCSNNRDDGALRVIRTCRCNAMAFFALIISWFKTDRRAAYIGETGDRERGREISESFYKCGWITATTGYTFVRWRLGGYTRWAFNYTDRPDRMDRRRGCCPLRVSNDCIHYWPISRDVLVLAISSSPPFPIPPVLCLPPSLSPVLVLFESSKGIACADVLKILCKVTTRCGHVSREQTRGEAPANLSQSRREKRASPKFFVRSCRKLTLVLNVIRRIHRVVPSIRKRRVSERRRDPMQPLDSRSLYHLPKTCRCFKTGENPLTSSRKVV